MNEQLQIRIQGGGDLPTLIYLPGLHGDWTLVSSFKAAVAGKARFVEITYPRNTTWSLADYARAIRASLSEHAIQQGWLLGESFGSQLVWAILSENSGDFKAQGVILAGGFAKHPVHAGVRMAEFLSLRWPGWFLRAALRFYGRYAAFRHRHAPETRACIHEFIRRRLEPIDRAAIHHRLGLIAANDPRDLVRQIQLPVFALIGLVDPIVPALPVWLWLRKHCPGYCAARLILNADHNVLGTAPLKSADQILAWLNATTLIPRKGSGVSRPHARQHQDH